MKPILILILTVFAAGCNSATNRPKPASTSMPGIWTVSATATSPGNSGFQCPQDCGPGTYQVTFVQVPAA